MAKEEAPAEEVVEPPKKKGKMLIIIIAVVAVLVLAGGGAAVYLLTSKPAAEKKADGHGDEEAKAEEAHADDEHPPIYEKLETFTVNLSDHQSYLQTEIQLMVVDAKIQEKIKAHMPEVRDALIRLLSSKSVEDLALPDGKDKLAEEIQKQVNEVLGIKKKSAGVKKVLFASFIIQ